MTQEAPAVEVDEISRRFGAIVAVDGVSLTVASGEFLSLLGPSGCGKTTLLRLIGGFEIPDSGRIRLLGEDVTEMPPYLRRTNMVFQHLALFPHRDVFDNIAFGLRMRKVGPDAIAKKVRGALELVRMDGFERRRIDELSGGQQQRVAIARAIVNEPAVLLLDEPFGALDLQLRLELQEELRRLQRTLGSPFIFVTHDQGEAMAMSDRIAVMNAGRIVQMGTPAEIYHQPESRFVAQFVGHTNLLDGHIEEVLDGRSYVMVADGQRISCSSSVPGLAKGQPVSLLIRQEAITVSQAANVDPGTIALQGKVVDMIFLGSTVRVKVQVGENLTLVSESGEPGAVSQWPVGSQVGVSWRVSQAKIFPR